jgi:hypothetical protein
LPIHSLHFLPLLAGVCPFKNLPVCLLYDERMGGSVNSPYAIGQMNLSCDAFTSSRVELA